MPLLRSDVERIDRASTPGVGRECVVAPEAFPFAPERQPFDTGGECVALGSARALHVVAGEHDPIPSPTTNLTRLLTDLGLIARRARKSCHQCEQRPSGFGTRGMVLRALTGPQRGARVGSGNLSSCR